MVSRGICTTYPPLVKASYKVIKELVPDIKCVGLIALTMATPLIINLCERKNVRNYKGRRNVEIYVCHEC
jgi:transposase-like protein